MSGPIARVERTEDGKVIVHANHMTEAERRPDGTLRRHIIDDATGNLLGWIDEYPNGGVVATSLW